ncbi:ABC transporter permease [Paenibacillus gansuensis]|uniref:ABC transporter permease n=1 Tax=Paenibacillus gansuensis TaxID=306542 RepID=A0ABW5PEM0_9BACL
MVNLIANENMKIYRRWRTWIMVILLVLMTCVVSYAVHRVMNPATQDWRASLQDKIRQQESVIQDTPEFMKKQMEEQLAVDKEYLKRDIPPVDSTFWGGVKNASGLILLITIFTVIVAGDIVAGEFTWGTIKLLLIRPASRSKILLSKYIASFLFALLLLAILFVTAVIANGVLYGFSGGMNPFLHVNGSGQIVETPAVLHVMQTYGYQCVQLIMVVTLAFMISTVFRSNSLSIGLSIFLMLISQAILPLIMNYSWGKYYLFANTDLTQYINGSPLMEGMSLGFSVAVLAVYFVLFNALSWLIFTKRDVAG